MGLMGLQSWKELHNCLATSTLSTFSPRLLVPGLTVRLKDTHSNSSSNNRPQGRPLWKPGVPRKHPVLLPGTQGPQPLPHPHRCSSLTIPLQRINSPSSFSSSQTQRPPQLPTRSCRVSSRKNRHLDRTSTHPLPQPSSGAPLDLEVIPAST